MDLNEKQRKIQQKYREKIRKETDSKSYTKEIFFIFIILVLVFVINSCSLFPERDVKIREASNVSYYVISK
ncbi:hypothetical protein [Cytobacillus firmus]|uniref:hypothetical protein n=1 Tax=Cytobacillus firmus TaxID=1399 RepID=UPI0021C76EB4|nr:hypothetical protein [Cytobacillus firmus]MCU1808165.1 hypothetical protein [Cytobacillus firmus]